jgi:hypothetical protein
MRLQLYGENRAHWRVWRKIGDRSCTSVSRNTPTPDEAGAGVHTPGLMSEKALEAIVRDKEAKSTGMHRAMLIGFSSSRGKWTPPKNRKSELTA